MPSTEAQDIRDRLFKTLERAIAELPSGPVRLIGRLFVEELRRLGELQELEHLQRERRLDSAETSVRELYGRVGALERR